MTDFTHLWPKERIQLNHHLFTCEGTSAESRRVTVDSSIPFHSLEQLVTAYPELLQEPNTLAVLVNFLLMGEHFRVITDVESFRLQFSQLHHPYGRFDISLLRPPSLNDDAFSFFVLSEINDLPYHVSCRFPFHDGSLNTKYELLPL